MLVAGDAPEADLLQGGDRAGIDERSCVLYYLPKLRAASLQFSSRDIRQKHIVQNLRPSFPAGLPGRFLRLGKRSENMLANFTVEHLARRWSFEEALNANFLNGNWGGSFRSRNCLHLLQLVP